MEQHTAQLTGFREWVEQIRNEWNVPGVAIAVIKDDEVILSEGFGLRNVKEGLPVTPDTLFPIGSSTKAFTAMVVAQLVDQGKLDWDTPVRDYLPEFKMADSFASERITLRDMLCHRSGLPRHDLMWYNADFSREEIIARVRHLELSKEFRTTWQYQNIMYLTAGYIAGKRAGCSWESLVKRQILDKLGMSATNFSVDLTQQSGDHARPYLKQKEEIRETPFRNIDTAGPAGSINSNLTDMVKWVRLHLHRGKHGEGQIVSEANLAEMHSPQMVIKQPAKYREVPHKSYGMGWFVEPYRGYNQIHHGGNIDGFTALVAMVPEEQIGIVILTNMNGTPLPTLIARNLYDRLLGLDQIDWHGRAMDEVEKGKAAAEEGKQNADAGRKSDTQPSHLLADYAGDYEHPGYGALKIEFEGETLTATYNSLQFAIKHRHYDIFEATTPLIEFTFPITFLTNLKGDIDRLTIQLETAVKPAEFARVAASEMSEISFLERFVGDYDLMGTLIAVALKGSTLTTTIPGQPTYELEPYRETTFNLKGLVGFSIEFKSDADGQFNEMVINQPNGVFAAKRA